MHTMLTHMGTIGLGAIPTLATFCRFFGIRPLERIKIKVHVLFNKFVDTQNSSA